MWKGFAASVNIFWPQRHRCVNPYWNVDGDFSVVSRNLDPDSLYMKVWIWQFSDRARQTKLVGCGRSGGKNEQKQSESFQVRFWTKRGMPAERVLLKGRDVLFWAPSVSPQHTQYEPPSPGGCSFMLCVTFCATATVRFTQRMRKINKCDHHMKKERHILLCNCE